MKIVFLLTMLSLSGLCAFCQETSGKQRDLSMRERYKPVGRPNTLTANFPTLMVIDYLLGTSAGLEYERFVNHQGTLSVSIPAHVFIAHTPNKGPHQAEIKGYYTAPALLYHPVGNTRFVDYSFGPAIAIGNLERTEHRNIDQFYSYDKLNFFAVQLQANMTVHTTGRFVFALHASGGSMLGNTVVQALFLDAGMKMGLRF
jgi:hypothetical protein